LKDWNGCVSQLKVSCNASIKILPIKSCTRTHIVQSVYWLKMRIIYKSVVALQHSFGLWKKVLVQVFVV